MQVVRSYWKDWPEGSPTLSQIPEVPLFNDVIYVYGEPAKEDIPELRARGYDVREIDEEYFNRDGYVYGRKLISLELAMMEFDRVLMIDWDCEPTREFDLDDPEFTKHLYGHEILVPVYAHPNQRYSYIYEDGHYISPNFGFVYCESEGAAHRLLEFAYDKNLDACIEEHAMFLYAIENGFKTWESYVAWYHPTVCYGVDPGAYTEELAKTEYGLINTKTHELVDSLLDMEPYFKHT